jgi:hypothetical protein
MTAKSFGPEPLGPVAGETAAGKGQSVGLQGVPGEAFFMASLC